MSMSLCCSSQIVVTECKERHPAKMWENTTLLKDVNVVGLVAEP
jgi:hypothetical protein